jgi:hypothetical protein
LESTLKTMFPNAGRLLYIVHSIEFQKRGLPHAHILLKFEHDCVHPDEINAVVNAEMPSDADDAQLVHTFMMHNHPLVSKEPSKYCQRIDAEGHRYCRFGYPQDLQPSTTIDAEGRVHYRRRKTGDEMVVPHCLPLLRKFRCHLNFEVANTSHLFQYLFKYIHKGDHLLMHVHGSADKIPGPDRAQYRIHTDDSEDVVDEIDDYWKARYLSTGEAAWRILGYTIAKKEPAVTPVSVHLDANQSNRQYHRRDMESSAMSTLNHYFCRPLGTFTYRGDTHRFHDLTYIEYFSLFRLQKFDRNRSLHANYFLEQPNVYAQPQMHVILRNESRPHLARIHDVPPSRGEVFYLRTLLQHRACSSHEDVRTVDDVQYETYQEAATELGLFANEKEAEYALLEGIHNLKTPRQLRLLFVHLLVNDCVPTPMLIWHNLGQQLALDHTLRHHNAVHMGIEYALRELGDMLSQHGKTLSNYNLPKPSTHGREVEHELVRWNADPDTLSTRADAAVITFNDEKRAVYDDVMRAVFDDDSIHIFVDGKAGTGKTYLLNVICDKVRSLGRIVLPTAAAAFAAQHYAGGRTTHSTFKV